MNKHLKYVLQVTLFFILILIIFYIMKRYIGFLNNILPWPGAIGGTIGYAVVLKQNNKKVKL